MRRQGTAAHGWSAGFRTRKPFHYQPKPPHTSRARPPYAQCLHSLSLLMCRVDSDMRQRMARCGRAARPKDVFNLPGGNRVPSPPGCQSAISAPLPPFWRPFLLTTGTASARPWTTSSSTLATDNVMAAAFEHEEGHRTLATPHPMLHQTHMAYWPTHVASHTLSRSLLLLASRTIHGYASPLTYATRAAAPHEPLSALSRLNSQHLTEPCSDVLTTTRV